jgi:hypothetical protein
MTHDQMTLFAAPPVQAESPPTRQKPARKPARTRTSAGDDAQAAVLALPLTTPMCELAGATATKSAASGKVGATSADVPTRPPSIPTPSIHAPEATPPMPENHDATAHAIDDTPAAIRTDRLWQLDGWTARVIKNEDDDGWAVEMLKDGEAEPALVGPWTMGRDKKNPKPLDQAAFNTLVKTATEVLQRHAQQAHAMLHKSLTVFALDAQWEVRLDITPDEYEPFATLSALDEAGDEVAQVRVSPDFRLTTASASAWIVGGFARPGGKEAFD